MLRKFQKTPPNFDKRKSFFAFNQSAYNKQCWGGTSNMAGNLVLTTTSTIKGAVVWDNKFILAYGLSKIKGTAKTDDRLELNSLGVKR
jgi:hypothetical protein